MEIITKNPKSIITIFDEIMRVTSEDGRLTLHFANSPSITLIKEDNSKEWGTTQDYGAAWGLMVSEADFDNMIKKIQEHVT